MSFFLTRKPSLSGSPRTAKRRRTLNNTCSTDEGDDQDLHDESGNPPNDVYEPKAPSTSTCRISSINDSNTYATFAPQDDLNTTPKSIVEPSKMEPATPRPPFSQIGIHNHVSLNLHFNNQHQQQQQQQPPPAPKPLMHSQQSSDSKLISERLIESLAQRFNDTQQQQRTSSHPHTIEYFHQGLQTESTSTISKPPPKLCSKPVTTTTTTTAINILPSRERPITTTSSNYDTSFVQPQNNDFKDDKVVRLTSAADRVLPAFHTFSELKNYLKTIGLDVELVPASNATPSNEVPPAPPPQQQQQQQARNIDPIQQRLPTNEQPHQFQTRSNTINVAQTPQQPQIVMLANNDSKCNRPSSISVPPNVLTERLLEYASSTLAIRPSQLSSRSSTLSSQSQQQRRSPTKPPIVSDIANLLSVSNNPNNKEQPIVQQVTRQTLLPPPPPPPPSSSSSTSATTVYHHHLTSADKVSTMVKRDLIHDDVHLHDREVEEYMNMAAAGRSTKQRKTTTGQTITDPSSKSIVLESGSASNSNDSNVSSTSSSSSIHHATNTNNNNNTHHHHHANVALTNSINKTKNNSALSSQDSRNICDILLMLYEQERTRSTQLQKQIEQVSRQHRSRNSSGQSHSSESQTGLETPQGPTNGTTNSARMLSPAWVSTGGKEKTSIHIQQSHHQTLKFDSSTSNNGSPPESQDVRSLVCRLCFSN